MKSMAIFSVETREVNISLIKISLVIVKSLSEFTIPIN